MSPNLSTIKKGILTMRLLTTLILFGVTPFGREAASRETAGNARL